MAKRTIDVHAHIVPHFYIEAMIRQGLVDRRGRPIADGFPVPAWSLEDTLRVMDAHNISASVLSITSPGVSFVPLDERWSLARRLNEELAAIVASFPKRFANLAILPLPDVERSQSELKFVMDEKQFDGVCLYSNYQGKYLGDPLFDPILADLNDRAVPLFVHPSGPPGFEEFGVGLPAPILEYPFDTTRMVANLLRHRTLLRFPKLRVIIPHGGGTVPYLAARIERGVEAFGSYYNSLSPGEASLQLSRIFYDLTSMGRPSNLKMLQSFVGASRLLVGYDYPFMAEASVKSQIAALDAFDEFGEEEKARIRTENALELFPRLSPSFRT